MADDDLLKEINAKIDRVLRALYGNGQPNEGLIAQTALNSAHRVRQVKTERVLFGGMAAALFGAVASIILDFLRRL